MSSELPLQRARRIASEVEGVQPFSGSCGLVKLQCVSSQAGIKILGRLIAHFRQLDLLQRRVWSQLADF